MLIIGKPKRLTDGGLGELQEQKKRERFQRFRAGAFRDKGDVDGIAVPSLRIPQDHVMTDA